MLKWWQIWPTYAHFLSTTGWRPASEILMTALLLPRLVEFIRIPSVLSTFWYTRSSPNPCEQGLWSCRATNSNERSSAVSPVSLSTPEREAQRSVMTLFPCSTDSLIFSCLNGCQFRRGSPISCTREGDALCLSGVASWPIRPHPLIAGLGTIMAHVRSSGIDYKEAREKQSRWPCQH